MIRATDIQNSLLPLIGWEQELGFDTKLSNALTESESGLYFQQAHPLLTLQGLSSIAPDFKNMGFINYEEFDTAKSSYAKNTIVEFNGSLYKALAETQGASPEDSNFWFETNPFSEWLELKTKASIQKAISRYCNEKILQGTYNALCENKILFDGTGRLVDTVKNKNNFVGFELISARAKGVTTKINKIGLQFTEPGEYTIYIWHSSQSLPYKTFTFTKKKKGSLEWFSLPSLYLPYQSDNNDAGGSWYIGYFQSELPEGSLAIKKDRDWSKEPCKACSRNDYISWQAWSKYLELHPFYVNQEIIDNEQGSFILWDQSKNQYTYDNNYGLNLDLSVLCDITDFIIEQKSIFQDAIMKQVAIDMLREIAYNANVRTNRHAINASRLDILYEIDGDSSSMKKAGLSYQLDLAINAAKLITSGLDRICLPCKNNGIKYRSI